jgi:hypothetical protein
MVLRNTRKRPIIKTYKKLSDMIADKKPGGSFFYRDRIKLCGTH